MLDSCEDFCGSSWSSSLSPPRGEGQGEGSVFAFAFCGFCAFSRLQFPFRLRLCRAVLIASLRFRFLLLALPMLASAQTNTPPTTVQLPIKIRQGALMVSARINDSE